MARLKIRHLIIGSKYISAIFAPTYLPIVVMGLLFLCSYLNMLPWFYKLFILLLVYCFTILLPTFLIKFYLKHRDLSVLQLSSKEHRIIPYAISILCYVGGMLALEKLHVPHFMITILLAALVIQGICALINALWWKPSTHAAGAGGVIGAFMAFALIFSFNPLWWFSIMIILAGLVGSSRIVLHQNGVLQIFVSFLIGAVCANLIILFV